MSSHLTHQSYAQALSFIRFRRMDGAPMSDLSPWAVGDSLAGAVGRCPSARPLRGGDLMVRCAPGDGQRLLAVDRVAGVEVRAWAPPHLNQSQGSIYAPSLQHLSIPELEEGFGRVGVRAVYRPPRAPKILILTFESPEPPSYVLAAYLSFDVRTILPKPMRCRRCLKFGHRQQHCRSPNPVCSLCARPGHDQQSCTSDNYLCAGCGGPHASDDAQCPRWIEESRVTLMMRRGWDRFEARRYVCDHPSDKIDSPFPPPPVAADIPSLMSTAAYPPLPTQSPRPPTSALRPPTPSGRPASTFNPPPLSPQLTGSAPALQRPSPTTHVTPSGGAMSRDPRTATPRLGPRPYPGPSATPSPAPGAAAGSVIPLMSPLPTPSNPPPSTASARPPTGTAPPHTCPRTPPAGTPPQPAKPMPDDPTPSSEDTSSGTSSPSTPPGTARHTQRQRQRLLSTPSDTHPYSLRQHKH